jgi:hypothetical protein
LFANGREAEVALESGLVRWLAAQEHSGANIGQTETHVIFVEPKERIPSDDASPLSGGEPRLGPASAG